MVHAIIGSLPLTHYPFPFNYQCVLSCCLACSVLVLMKCSYTQSFPSWCLCGTAFPNSLPQNEVIHLALGMKRIIIPHIRRDGFLLQKSLHRMIECPLVLIHPKRLSQRTHHPRNVTISRLLTKAKIISIHPLSARIAAPSPYPRSPRHPAIPTTGPGPR